MESSTLHGNPKRGTGLLNNELYVGRLIWNRLRYLKDPDTGKRVSRLNPASEWVVKEVPQLRIIPDDVWNAAKARQTQTRQAISRTGKLATANRPRYLFSGLTKCGVCGGGFVMASANRLACFGARDQGICSNHMTIRRDEVEARVLTALQEKLLHQDLFAEFCEEFTREMNRLRMEFRASQSVAEREIARIEARRKKLIEMVMEGVPAAEVRDEMIANAARRDVLQARLVATDELPPLLHTGMAALYRKQVESLAEALARPESRLGAAEALRGLVDRIVLVPEGDTLRIELKGNLAAMLATAQETKRPPETGDLFEQVALVAGARNKLYRQLCWAAA